jgi:hypothetical protein
MTTKVQMAMRRMRSKMTWHYKNLQFQIRDICEQCIKKNERLPKDIEPAILNALNEILRREYENEKKIYEGLKRLEEERKNKKAGCRKE